MSKVEHTRQNVNWAYLGKWHQHVWSENWQILPNEDAEQTSSSLCKFHCLVLNSKLNSTSVLSKLMMQLSSSALLCWFEVGCWSKRHFCDDGIVSSASHNNLELSVLLAVLLVHITHSNVLLQAWTESTAGNLSNLHDIGHNISTQGVLGTGAEGRGGGRGM